MGKFIRYAIAAIFFAASVGCLALWWRSSTIYDSVAGPIPSGNKGFMLVSDGGSAWLSILYPPSHETVTWEHITFELPKPREAYYYKSKGGFELFSSDKSSALYLPIWCAALVFALAGVGVLRFRRQFSIRSAMITVSVVAALLGMIVAL